MRLSRTDGFPLIGRLPSRGQNIRAHRRGRTVAMTGLVFSVVRIQVLIKELCEVVPPTHQVQDRRRCAVGIPGHQKSGNPRKPLVPCRVQKVRRRKPPYSSMALGPKRTGPGPGWLTTGAPSLTNERLRPPLISQRISPRTHRADGPQPKSDAPDRTLVRYRTERGLA